MIPTSVKMEFDFLQYFKNLITLCLIETEKNTTKNSLAELEVDVVAWKSAGKCKSVEKCHPLPCISPFQELLLIIFT